LPSVICLYLNICALKNKGENEQKNGGAGFFAGRR